MLEFANSQILGYILYVIDGPLSFTFSLVGCSWLGGTINRGKLYHILKTGLVIGRCQVSVSITIHSQSLHDLEWSYMTLNEVNSIMEIELTEEISHL